MNSSYGDKKNGGGIASKNGALQHIGLLLLSEFHRICIRNDIEYIIFAGTLLGSIRTDSWIEWDDDIDVAMTRCQFEKLVANSPQFSDSYKLVPPEVSQHLHEIARLEYVNSRFGVDGSCVSLDIFILDHSPNNFVIRNLWACCCVLLRLLRTSKDVNPTDGFGSRAVAFAILRMASSMRPQEYWHRLYSKISRIPAQRNAHFSITTLPLNLARRKIPESAVFPTKTLRFENINVLGPNNSDFLLKMHYGVDYLQPPPIDKRVSPHIKSSLSALIDGTWMDFS